MADFFQTQKLCTLSDICFDYSKVNLHNYNKATIIVLVPCHVCHLENQLILQLAKQLKLVDYLTEIVIVVNGLPKPATEQIRKLQSIDTRITILLESASNTELLNKYLTNQSSSLYGKGFALWLGFMYILQKYDKQVFIATIDADIKNFSQSLLLKLLFPLVQFDAAFNKGYYVRYSQNKLDGRLTRILIFPLLQAMQKQTTSSSLLDFLTAFRYPLSGEVAITSTLLRKINLQQGWSYDLYLLEQVQKNLTNASIFQTEITTNHEHLHRNSESDRDYSLMEVAIDIINYLRGLYPLDINKLASDYLYIADEFIKKYEKLATFNGLNFYPNDERKLSQQLIILIKEKQYNSNILPSWEQVNGQEKLKKFITDLII